MIKLYNKSGDFCWCNPDQVESMKSVGYTLDTNPIEQEKIDTIVEQIQQEVVEKPKKSLKKDIIL